MKDYVDIVLKKVKKPILVDIIYHNVECLISSGLGREYVLNDNDKKEIDNILSDGVENYDYIMSSTNEYIHIEKTGLRKGTFYADRNGNGIVSVISSYYNKDYEYVVLNNKYTVYKDYAGGAIDGDIVLINISEKNGVNKVEKILDRKIEHVIGEIYRIGSAYYVKPNDKKKQNITILVPKDAVEGQRVEVSLEEKTAENFYIGRIEKVFNHKDDPDEDILWEAFKHGIDNEISLESQKQLESIPNEVRDVDKIGREDFTSWNIFTIDGIDTKDMDDAVSCTINSNGNYELGVHITDIASIVPNNSPLDKDAFMKGNSYYLGGKVFPMFDHKISNGIGSLNPFVDRLTISVIMEIDSNGNIINYRITPSVINSKLKMSYDKVNDILKNGKIDSDYSEFVGTLKLMQKLALILKKNRVKKGAISFDRPEPKLIYDDDGNVVDFSVRKQDIAENLIEEFMLAANETVDKHMTKNGIPCVHRIHEAPNPEKIDKLLMFLDAINLPFSSNDSDEIANSKVEFQKFANHLINSGRLSNMLTAEGVKCMSRAKYSQFKIGHYGLGKQDYCHFTSPVRRYADLTQQRILWDCLFNYDDNLSNRRKWERRIPEIAERTSYTEKVADDAERDVFRMQYCKYMENHIGDEFEATITGVYSDSIDIELDNLIDGKVYIRDMNGEYLFDCASYSLISVDDDDDYFIGDRLLVKVKSVNVEQKKVTFSIIEKKIGNDIMESDFDSKKVKVKNNIK